MQFTIKDKTFDSGRLNAFQQLHVVRRLAPVTERLVALAGSAGAPEAFLGPLARTVGELPDAARYGDEGSNTLSHVAKETKGFSLPNMAALGLGCIEGVQGLPCPGQPGGGYGRMAEKSKGKDTTTGHWELAGLTLEKPFPTYPNGFPPEVIQEFEDATGMGTIAIAGLVEASAEALRLPGGTVELVPSK